MGVKKQKGLKLGNMYLCSNEETSTKFQPLTDKELERLKAKYPNAEEVKE